jgi:hypothetical protein
MALASACSSGGDSVGPGDGPGPTPVNPPTPSAHEREIRGGRVHDVMVSGIADANTADPGKLIAAVQADLRGRLGAIQATDFVEVHRNLSQLKGGARLLAVTLRQTIGGVPVDGTYLYAVVRYDQRGAQLVSSSYRLFENPAVDVRSTIVRDRAVALANQTLRFRTPVAPKKSELVVRQIDGNLQLAWSLQFPGSYRRAFVVASGASAGRVHTVDQRVYDTSGTITGPVARGGAPGGLGTISTEPVPDAKVAGPGGTPTTNANGSGVYSINVANGTALTASLNGKASVVVDQLGVPLTATAPAVANGTTNLPMVSTNENGQSQTTAYFFVTVTRNYLEANGIPEASFGAPLTTNTNLNDTCNAFYDPGARDINFFHSGGGCNNSAIDTVVSHEYGHFVDDNLGGITDGGLSEGWGDVLGCYISKQHLLGFDLIPGETIRDCQNDYLYPPGGNDEVHNLGQAWMGFAWDVRTNLIAALGEDAGDALARSLVLPSLATNAVDIPAAVREVFLRDDDDGNLDNLTPHWDQLAPAAIHHALLFAVQPDDTAPDPVTNLAVTNVEPTKISLSWTASGDDGSMGTAASYQLRWSTQPITPANFAAANLVPTAAPHAAGTPETGSAIVPPETTIFLALIVVDEQFNQSTLSNVVSATTPAGTPVFTESFETNAPGWTATGLWHITTKRASDATHSFWYGQEATGNYDTGATNSGDLTSPDIDLSNVGAPVLILDQFIDTEPDPFDVTQVIITDANDPTHTATVNKTINNSGGAFVSRVIPLTGFDGKHITLRFHFDTLDPILNAFEGWYLDHLRIIGSDSCDHSPCVTGGPLDPTCSTCVQNVCSFDPFCCNIAWDSICVNEAKNTCGAGTCTTCGNGTCEPGETAESCPADCKPACAHDVCDAGPPLDPACDDCATDVCATDPFCCTVFWDRVCVEESNTVCGKTCADCSHDACNVGGPLAANCSACATNTCAADPFCCEVEWDSRCVQEAADGCGLSCTVCTHSLCSQGNPLETSCDPCVAQVCATDPYCCNNTWDGRCIDQAQTTCGLQCVNDRLGDGTASAMPSR